ncbi:MAG: hypothetical protein LH472_11740 [Pyrinomonadaceae bacterium]|nr:hypothetical protein [Pyrinomonadaceae bacterium]
MQNFDKIYPPSIAVPVNRPIFFSRAKAFVWRGLPTAFKAMSVGFILLILQIAAVGILDRAGISPKISFIFSSLAYVFVLTGLLSTGRLVKVKSTEAVNDEISGEPICKILIIKREGAIKL